MNSGKNSLVFYYKKDYLDIFSNTYINILIMKKFFFYLFGALAITACTNDEFTELALHEECNVVVTDSFYVPYETALKYALEAIDNGNTAITRSASPERRVASHYEYVANKMTRSANDGVEVRFHVINFEDNLH